MCVYVSHVLPFFPFFYTIDEPMETHPASQSATFDPPIQSWDLVRSEGIAQYDNSREVREDADAKSDC